MTSRLLLLFAGLGFLTQCQTPPADEGGTRPVGENVLTTREIKAALRGEVDFVSHIKPILATKCIMCHDGASLPGRMNLSNRREAVRTGTLGGLIIPGYPDRSKFLTQLDLATAHVKAMPPVGERVTEDEEAILRRWIEQGAAWPDGDAGAIE